MQGRTARGGRSTEDRVYTVVHIQNVQTALSCLCESRGPRPLTAYFTLLSNEESGKFSIVRDFHIVQLISLRDCLLRGCVVDILEMMKCVEV